MLKKYLLFLSSIIFLYFGFLLLSIGIWGAIILNFIFKRLINIIKNPNHREIGHFFSKLLLFLILSFFVSKFLFTIYKIPSKSMTPTLSSGDLIIVNKLRFGIKPNKKKSIIKIDFKIKRGDVLVFKVFYENKVQTLIKRCVGKPLDKIVMRKGKLFINNTNLPNFDFIEKPIAFKEKDSLSLFSLKDSYKNRSATLTPLFLNSIKKEWNKDNFGPYLIPKRGMKVRLNRKNFMLYKFIISKYENSILKKNNDTYYINNKKAKFYTFKHNYYFLLGDNRKLSIDSRYWGVIPEHSFLGKAEAILFSDNKFVTKIQ